jgi:FkbM family methyltransferase
MVITDSWGLRYIYYPWEAEELKDIISREFYKPELLAIKKLVKKDDVVVDVGANVGVFSAYLSREVGSTGRVFAFEPVEETFWRLKETLAINRCENVSAYQTALSNKSGVFTMNIFEPQYSAWNSFGRPEFGDVKPVGAEKVVANTLDKFTDKHGLKKIDFVKIDVEGFEKDVLEGAKNLLKTRAIGSLSFEISDIPLKGGGRIAQDVFDLLASFGYTAYRYDSASDKFIGPVTDSSDDYQNFYASRRRLEDL